jgi:hypothetical protein
MSVRWDDLEIGSRVEALETFEVQMGMGAPVGSGLFNIEAGDTGEVTVKRKAGKLHWLVIKWNRLGRTFNLNVDQFYLVRPAKDWIVVFGHYPTSQFCASIPVNPAYSGSAKPRTNS